MERIQINSLYYYTNITDNDRLNKCIDFYSNGCTSCVVSFDNKQSDVIMEKQVKGKPAKVLKSVNFAQCFLPSFVSNCTKAVEIARKGYDLIELL